MKFSSLLPSWVASLGRRLGAASMGHELPVFVGGACVGDIAEWRKGA